MKRKIVKIDEEKCNGCGLCAQACHEGAIGMVNGKAKLLRDDYCDGLGDCLPVCPADAITIEEREAVPYDKEQVEKNMAVRRAEQPAGEILSEITTWPVQIKLVPVNAPYFHGADLLIAADCTAFAYGDFHRRFMAGKVTLVGCPKLDAVDYSQKLADIFRENEIRSVTLTRMEVPCCGGMEWAIGEAIKQSGKALPFRVAVISTTGELLEEREQ